MLTEKTFYIIPYYQLDDLISQQMQFKLSNSVTSANEMLNDHVYAFEDMQGNDDDFDLMEINKDVKLCTISQFNVSDWISYLIWNGTLPQGNYLITV
jgi:hypothetical protein